MRICLGDYVSYHCRRNVQACSLFVITILMYFGEIGVKMHVFMLIWIYYLFATVVYYHVSTEKRKKSYDQAEDLTNKAGLTVAIR